MTVTDDPADLVSAERIVLPGVGAFAPAYANLCSKGFDEAIKEAVACRSVPLLGICLGMQLLAESSAEGGERQGLGLLPGAVVRLESLNDERIPHMGWNSVTPTDQSTILFDGIAPGTDFYFVHSYHLRCPESVIAARTDYCGGFVSSAVKGSVMAVQFHPEKSQKAGFRLLQNFLAS